MNSRKLLILLPLIIIVDGIFTKISAQQSPPENSFAVIAYCHGAPEDIDLYPVEKLTHIIYSFLHLDGNQFFANKYDSLAITKLTGLKSRNPELKVILSLGGWGGCPTCSDVFETEQGRSDFSNSVKYLLKKYKADGLDLDWEYPALESIPGFKYSPDDKQNFTLLIRSLRQTLGNSYELSFAGGGFTDFFYKSVEWDKVMPLIDRVNIMTYDYINGYSTKTGHHAPLFSTPEQEESTENAVRILDSLGVPKNKMVIGAAFYARIFKNTDSINHGLYRNCQFEGYIGYRDFAGYFDQHPGFTFYWDDIAKAPYAYNFEQQLFTTFDDERSVALKTTFAKENGLNGIMFWSLNSDAPNNGLIDVIHKTLNNKPTGNEH
jgi:chitinase